VLAIAGPGDILCVESVFADRAYGVSAEALEDAMLLHVGKSVLLAELQRNSAFAHALIQTLSGRVAAVMRDLESCTLLSARDRVIEFLLGLAHGADSSKSARLRLPAKKRIVASRLNLTHEHFSRILHQLADEELIRIEGRDIEIANLPRLRTLLA
jgi:CRP-like cAMP-binding protein